MYYDDHYYHRPRGEPGHPHTHTHKRWGHRARPRGSAPRSGFFRSAALVYTIKSWRLPHGSALFNLSPAVVRYLPRSVVALGGTGLGRPRGPIGLNPNTKQSGPKAFLFVRGGEASATGNPEKKDPTFSAHWDSP